jgi:hypothetical protein
VERTSLKTKPIKPLDLRSIRQDPGTGETMKLKAMECPDHFYPIGKETQCPVCEGISIGKEHMLMTLTSFRILNSQGNGSFFARTTNGLSLTISFNDLDLPND